MKLFGRGKAKAPQPMDMATLRRRSQAVEEIAVDGAITAEGLRALGAKLGVPREELYAGLGASPMTTLELEHELQFEVCLGVCQERGALPCTETLLTIRDKRLAAGADAFDVVPRQCLSRCANAPAVKIRTTDGDAVLGAATPKALAKAVKQLLG